MLRIGFDASPLVRPVGGVGWHVFHLVNALLELDRPHVQFVGYLSSKQQPTHDYSYWIRSGKLVWVQAKSWGRWMSQIVKDIDVYHGMNFKMPFQGVRGGIVTIHDLWLDRFPQYSKKLLGQTASFYRTRRTAWKAKRVIAVSRFTSDDLCDLYGLPQERIAVIPNGVSSEFFVDCHAASHPEVYERYQLPASKYVLFLGGANPRKNHMALFKALVVCRDILKTHCVVVVGSQRDRSCDVMETARRFGVEDRVVCVGTVSVPELRWLYSAAELFVFPSMYEGFGMPVLEAMACGVPVVTSDCSALREVGDDAAVLVNPYDANDIARGMRLLLENPNYAQMMRDKGLKRAKKFTWEHAARKTFEVYESICS